MICRRPLMGSQQGQFQTMCLRTRLRWLRAWRLETCITTWARSSIHVTQKLAGHADIQTTQRYYLSVQEEDLRAARRAQQQTVKGLIHIAPTDQKLTNSARKRDFPKRKLFADGMQLPPEVEVA